MAVININSCGEAPRGEVKYAIIASRYRGLWIFVRERNRNTWEMPGGHIEAGESPDAAAERELREETGAVCFNILFLGYYSVSDGEYSGYGSLFLAEVNELGSLPLNSEICELMLSENMPERLTYPSIQPTLFQYAIRAAANS